MVEIDSDIVKPSILIVPTAVDATTMSGAGVLFISGAKLHFCTGTKMEQVTSA